jgi:hypothetical protein
MNNKIKVLTMSTRVANDGKNMELKDKERRFTPDGMERSYVYTRF